MRLLITLIALLISSITLAQDIEGCTWHMADNYDPDATISSSCIISVPPELEVLLIDFYGFDLENGSIELNEDELIEIFLFNDVIEYGFTQEYFYQLDYLAPYIYYFGIYDYNTTEEGLTNISSLNFTSDYSNLVQIELFNNNINQITIGDLESLEQVYIQECNDLSVLDLSNISLSTDYIEFEKPCSESLLTCIAAPNDLNLYVFGCTENVIFSNESCELPDIGVDMNGNCQLITDWATDWVFNENLFSEEPNDQQTPSPFNSLMGFEVNLTDSICLNEVEVSFNPLDNWGGISIEILDNEGEVLHVLAPGDTVTIETNDPIDDPWFYESGGYSELGCSECGEFMSVFDNWIWLDLQIVMTPTCSYEENNEINSFYGENLYVNAQYINSWSNSSEEEEENEGENQAPVGCYFAHINSDGLNEVVWEYTGDEEYQNSEIKVFRQSINYDSSSSYGWEEIGTATMTDELFIDSNEFYTQFETRYKFDVITETTTYSECEGESVNVDEWQSYMIRTSVLSISNSPTQDVNLYWNSSSNIDYYKLRRRQNSDDDFEDYIDLPHYITSFTDRNPHTGYSEYIVVSTLSNGQYCTPNGNFELTSNIVVNDNSFICTPGCTYEPAINYNPQSTIDDGTCLFDDPSDNTCIADLDGNGQVGTPDLLLFLGEFGTTCE